MLHSASSLSTFIAVAAVVVVMGGAASRKRSPTMSDLTQEIAYSLVVNQLAILKGMNESSSFCASRERELSSWMEEANTQLQETEDSLQAMVEDMQARMQNMTEETMKNLRGMAEDVQSRMLAVEETVQAQQQALKAMEGRQQVVEETVQTHKQALKAMEGRQQVVEEMVQTHKQALEAAEGRQQVVEEMVQAQQQTLEAEEGWQQAVEEMMEAQQQVVHTQQQAIETVGARLENTINILQQQVAMQAFHNDTEPSLCDETGATKVLHGGRGTLYARGNENICVWRVVLPEGTKPVFQWYWSKEECDGCHCGRMAVFELHDGGEKHKWTLCRGVSPYHHHPVNNVTANFFIVKILQNRKYYRKFGYSGFVVHYQAVPIERRIHAADSSLQ